MSPTVDLFHSGVRLSFTACPYLIQFFVSLGCHNRQQNRRREERLEEQSPMDGIEGSPPPHLDYEDDFSDRASLGRGSYNKDEEDTYETSRTGFRDIIFTGMVCHFFFHRPHP